MFKAGVNTACINTLFTGGRMRRMEPGPVHAATERVYQAARVRLRLAERPKPSIVAKEVNISQQALKNWEKRGPSNVGLVEWQLAKGVNASWVVTGRGPMFIPDRPQAGDAPAPWRASLLSDELLRALAALDADALRRIENSIRGQLDMPARASEGNERAA